MTERPWNPIGRAAQADRAVNDMLKKMETCKSCTGNCAGSGACHGTAAEKRAGAPAEDKKIAKKTAAPAPSGPRPRGETAPAAAVLPEIPQALKKNPNRAENEFMMNLMVLRNSLAKYSPATKERARLAGKYVWRDIRLLFRLVCKIQDALIRTMPDRRDDYYRAYAQHGHYEMKMDGPVRGTTRYVLISDTNLAAITEERSRVSAPCACGKGTRSAAA